MSWAQNLCDTYDACAEIVGIYGEGQEILLPLAHLSTVLNISVYLNNEGMLQRIEQIKSMGKKKMRICVPCTDDSEARSGSKAIDFPHPLFDQIGYLDTQVYQNNLKKWMDYLKDSPQHQVAYQSISAVYRYIEKGSLKSDLENNKIEAKKSMFIGFCVDIDKELENRLWMKPELWKAWIDYYLGEGVEKEKKKGICYVTGLNSPYTEKHPKAINRVSGNAKLISGNDRSNFTFRGRFEEPSQAVTVSYVASQKIHQTLRWLISKSNCYQCDTQAIFAWAIDKMPEVQDFGEDSFEIYNNMVEPTEAEEQTRANSIVYVDYAQALKKALSGHIPTVRLKTHGRRVAIMATDAATEGRMSISYYRELSQNEYEERIEQWHNTCKWYQPFEQNSSRHYKSEYFIGAPSMDRITLTVLGKRLSKKDKTYDKLVKSTREQVLHCIFDGERIPLHFMVSALNRASNPLAFENKAATNGRDRWRDWEFVLGSACTLIKRYYHDYKKEEFAVELETKRCDRDYLYGRLLAVADRIESHASYKQGKVKGDERATNAMRYMTIFSQRPFRTWHMLLTQQLNPYIQQLDGANYYFNLIGEIQQLFGSGEFERDEALDGRYLLGFFAQRQKFREKSKNN